MKTILITGATSGIGEACARHCLAQGDRVVAICRNLDKARDKFAAEIEAGRFVPLHYDLSCNDQLYKLCMDELKPYSIDRFIHCAGITLMQKVTSTSHDVMLKMFETHVFSLTEIVRALLRLRKSEQELSMLALSSMSSPGLTCIGGAYSMAKASIDYYVRLINKQLNAASRKYLLLTPEQLAAVDALEDEAQKEFVRTKAQAQSGLMVRINSLAPNLIDTPMINYEFLQSQGLNVRLIPMDVVVQEIFNLLENKYVSGKSVILDNGVIA